MSCAMLCPPTSRTFGFHTSPIDPDNFSLALRIGSRFCSVPPVPNCRVYTRRVTTGGMRRTEKGRLCLPSCNTRHLPNSPDIFMASTPNVANGKRLRYFGKLPPNRRSGIGLGRHPDTPFIGSGSQVTFVNSSWNRRRQGRKKVGQHVFA